MHINCIGKKGNFHSVLTVIDALLTKAFPTTYTPLPARTKTPNRFILHYLFISSQPVKHHPHAMQYTLHWKKVKFYSFLTVIDALLTKAFHSTYTPVSARTTTPTRFILHYLFISSQPVKHHPHAMQYTLLWKKVKFYCVLTVIVALLTKAFQTTYTTVPARTKTPNRFILHYLVISSQTVKHLPPPCHTYTLHRKIGKSENSIRS